MKTITERLTQYMDFKGLNANKITVEAGLSNGLIGKSIKNNTGINSDTIEKILTTYKDISPLWFVVGEGEMLREDQEALASKKIVENASGYVEVNEALIVDMYRKVDYLFQLSLHNNVEKDLEDLRKSIIGVTDKPLVRKS